MENTFLIWNELKALLGEEVPDVLRRILVFTGFDRKLCLQNINNDDIADIENFIYENRMGIDLQGTIYRDQQIFKLAPGHKTFLLLMSEKIKERQNHQQQQKVYVAKEKLGDDHIIPADLPAVLKDIFETFIRNKDRHKNFKRYSDTIKYFFLYIYLIGGRLCYETLSQNLPIPTIGSINRYLQIEKPEIVEGKLRVEELNNYLEQLGVEKTVWLSEDATGIVSKVEYHPATNQIIGFVLPLNCHGMPIALTYMADSAERIKEYMINNIPRSKLVYLILAQPMKENTPPFILSIFGTDNKFSTEDVLKRWKYTNTELMKFGIKVLGVSSDGDTRLLRGMKINTQLGSVNNEFDFFNIKSSDVSYVQDTIHIGTKLRNRILTPSIVLPMGKKIVSISHLKILIGQFPKEDHKLVMSDLSYEDRQNFHSLEKLMDPCVRSSLQRFIPDSEATIQYIDICFKVTESFLNTDIAPLQRVELIWEVVFF